MADPFALSVQYQNDVRRSLDDGFGFAKLSDERHQNRLIEPRVLAQNRIAQNEAVESDRQLSVNEQLQEALTNPRGFANEFGNLKTAGEMRKFMSRHSAIVATPFGERVMQRFDRIATATEQAELHSIEKQLEVATAKKRAEFLSEATDAGVNVQDPEEMRAYRIRRNKIRGLDSFEKRANAAGLNPFSVQFGKDAFDELGNLDEDAARMMLGQATPAQRLVTQQEIADARTVAQTAIANIRAEAQKAGGGYAPSQVERKIIEAERHGVPFTQEEIHDMLRISAGTMPRIANTKTMAAFIDSKLGTFMRADEFNGIKRSDKERVEYLRGLYDEVYGQAAMKWNDQTGELTE